MIKLIPSRILPASCRYGSALLFLAASLPQGFSQTTEWIYHKTADGAHPDGNEQELVWLMNRARANPSAEGTFLRTTGDANVENGINFFKVDRNLLQTEFNAIAAKPPAAFDRRLYEASKQHSQYLIANDVQDHSGQIARVDALFSRVAVNVSVYSYAISPVHGHGALNIDWGPGGTGGMQSGRGHRVAIMSNQSTLLTNVGFAMLPDSDINTDAGPLVFSGAYCSANTTAANQYNRFLTGTVWKDTNNNNRYDAGEGLNNVRIQPNSGTFYAITGVAGGWSIPITTAATYTLTYSGSALSSNFTRTATVDTTSVLVDTKVTDSAPTPAPMTLAVGRAPNGSDLILTWAGGTPPYQVQRSTTMTANSWTNVGASTTATTATHTPSGPRAYYRVKGS